MKTKRDEKKFANVTERNMNGIIWSDCVCVEHMCAVATDAAANCTVECVDNFSLLNLMDVIQTIRTRSLARSRAHVRPFEHCCGM